MTCFDTRLTYVYSVWFSYKIYFWKGKSYPTIIKFYEIIVGLAKQHQHNQATVSVKLLVHCSEEFLLK